MTPTWRRIMWVIELLVKERPRRVSDIVASTGWSRRDVDDACYELVQESRIVIRPDSFMVAAQSCLVSEIKGV